ncbi:MAG TPA: gluconate 2-dehydrogenase subunit 3 family protein [Cyclobacteriaceae bacterium]|nr:gluconate 2-dehydrogenase subunit 3 family protein [Cyclobacteriaceae bacterium]
MNRREALTATAAFLGSTIIGSQAFLSGCRRSETKIEDFNEEVLGLLDEVGETILPATTSSPGAKAGKIGEFMKVIVTDCYSPEEQKIFFEGISTIQQAADKKYGRSFVKLDDPQKFDLMVLFDQEARKLESEKGREQMHFFSMLNQLTVWGFFSSEPGATRALRYVPIPGRYEGCIPYKEGDGAWVY